MDLNPELMGTVAAPTVGTGAFLAYMIRNALGTTRKKLEKLDAKIDDLKEDLTKIRILLAESGVKNNSQEMEKLKERVVRIETLSRGAQ